MLYLLMIQDRAERTMNLHYQITVKEYLEDSWSTWFVGNPCCKEHAQSGASFALALGKARSDEPRRC
jgi:hypothetical protein